MALQIVTTAIPEVKLIKPGVFSDDRGYFMETFHVAKYRSQGLDTAFVQDNHSRSTLNVLRGLHYQLRKSQDKLVMATQGAIFDVAVDIRRGSPTFGAWVGEVLSDENHYQLLIPRGFAHGFCALTPTADILYKCSDYFDPTDDRGIVWSDPAIGIRWPVHAPILSTKDQRLPNLKDADAAGALPTYTGN